MDRLENSLLYSDHIEQAKAELYFALGDVLHKTGKIEKALKPTLKATQFFLAFMIIILTGS